jgi:transposase InsO family protein
MVLFERFNRSYREAVLDLFVFHSLQEVRDQTEQWLKEYNEERPHDALGDLTPPRIFIIPQTRNLYKSVVMIVEDLQPARL